MRKIGLVAGTFVGLQIGFEIPRVLIESPAIHQQSGSETLWLCAGGLIVITSAIIGCGIGAISEKVVPGLRHTIRRN